MAQRLSCLKLVLIFSFLVWSSQSLTSDLESESFDSEFEISSYGLSTPGSSESALATSISDQSSASPCHILSIDSEVRREIFEFAAINDVWSALNFARTCKFLHKAMTVDVCTSKPMLPRNRERFWRTLFIHYIGQKSGHYAYFRAFHQKDLEALGLNSESLFKILQSKELKGKLVPFTSTYFRYSTPLKTLPPYGGLLIKPHQQALDLGLVPPYFLRPDQQIRMPNSSTFTIEPVTNLDLRNTGLVVLTRFLEKMTHLRVLDIAENKLRGLPIEIGKLPLTHLFIFRNPELKRLPQALQNCKSLKQLFIDDFNQYDFMTQYLLGLLQQRGVRIFQVGGAWNLQELSR